CMQGTELPYSF
nr:immunoglobulin light chain junction region [Macaca mulatta]MOV93030.1 immunoglobulin light chain junction region [Macaca mulatta]MOV93116.1 immunoglobulin light chain junction region [Macaca mulatta]MOV93299.1 immunoglobulin light chain junction region [Macaca mulatta]MOV93619.1 immunoglobulin light chain junction region [Macaca mulatta]